MRKLKGSFQTRRVFFGLSILMLLLSGLAYWMRGKESQQDIEGVVVQQHPIQAEKFEDINHWDQQPQAVAQDQVHQGFDHLWPMFTKGRVPFDQLDQQTQSKVVMMDQYLMQLIAQQLETSPEYVSANEGELYLSPSEGNQLYYENHFLLGMNSVNWVW